MEFIVQKICVCTLTSLKLTEVGTFYVIVPCWIYFDYGKIFSQ